MKIQEIQKNLFHLDNSYFFAHCISADYALGAGIAVEFEKRYGLRRKLYRHGDRTYPNLVVIENVLNLVTKEKYWHKPTYASLEETLVMARNILEERGATALAMLRIGSGLDKLEWGKVKAILERVFAETDVEITVCYL